MEKVVLERVFELVFHVPPGLEGVSSSGVGIVRRSAPVVPRAGEGVFVGEEAYEVDRVVWEVGGGLRANVILRK
jgi:hypothetical protein